MLEDPNRVSSGNAVATDVLAENSATNPEIPSVPETATVELERRLLANNPKI